MRFIRSAVFSILLASAPPAVLAQSSGSLQRVPNTTLQMPSNPAGFGYTTANAFPGLSFNQPVCIASPPGETNRLFVLEKGGSLVVITNLAAPTRTLFMTLTVDAQSESGLLGLAFHPGHATNRYLYVFYSLSTTTSQGTGLHQRISRFRASAVNPNQVEPGSELVLITQRDDAGNHNGGDLHFGPDGYLYASVGDGGAQYDGSRHSQRIDRHFFSAVLRLDVDKRPGNLPPNPHPANSTNYFVPADNPYLGLTSFNGIAVNPANIRTEFYAIGFRNPWRMSFDPLTGFLYLGDVGQDRWEEVNVIVKGGNYGWVWRDGLHPGYRTTEAPPGFTSINPIQEYAHGTAANQGNSISGGVVYRGQRLSQLYGAYVFGDYTSGNLWALRYDGVSTIPFQRLTSVATPVAFGIDPGNGDILIASLGGTIQRLNYNSTSTGTPLPPTLQATGAFSDLATLTPHPGIVPYSLNVPFWSDNAHKTRWFSIPDTNLTMVFRASSNWTFPSGTVWVKHFDLELTNGVPESTKRLETRFIVRNAGGVYGVTYRWDSATNATLVPEGGLDETLLISDGGTVRTQVWRYPGRAECLTCHTAVGGHALGFNTAQLNRTVDYGAGAERQIAALSQAGYFSTPVTNQHTLRSLAAASDSSQSLESRVRSYLAANCVQCHQPGGPATAFWDARIATPTAQAGIVNGALVNNGGNPDHRVIVPGSLSDSTLLERISIRGPGQMPPLASSELDTAAIQLVSAWITNDLPSYQTFAQWQVTHFGSTNAAAAAAGADPDGDQAINSLEYLTGTNPQLAGDAWGITFRRNGGSVEVSFNQIANRRFEVQWTDSLQAPIPWRPLDVAGNEPLFSATDLARTVSDTIAAGGDRYYRVRVDAP